MHGWTPEEILTFNRRKAEKTLMELAHKAEVKRHALRVKKLLEEIEYKLPIILN